MAGTGHSYEIANILDVRDEIARLVRAAAGDQVLIGWLSSRSFLKYATSEPFVFKARKTTHIACLDTLPDVERQFIERKLEDDGDVRLFAIMEFRRYGPDVPHILDWMAYLRETKPQDVAKITRMSAEELIRKLASWIRPKSRKTALPGGSVRHILDTDDGYSWVELLDREALLAEGDAMAHCVDGLSYANALECGRIRILSLRTPEGRRLLTMELTRSGFRNDSLSVRQIQAFANHAPPEGAIGSICAILNLLSVTPHGSDQERRAKIAHVAGEGWQSIYRTWKRLELEGLECMTDGDELVFMSPVHPAKPLVNVTSLLRSGFRHLGDEISVPVADGIYQVRLADARHFTIEELRAAARIANSFGAPIEGPAFETRYTDACVPFVDTLAEQIADGRSFLRDERTGDAYVVHPSDKALVLLEISRNPRFATMKDKPFTGSLPAWACNLVRWKEEDLRRCLSAMSAVRATEFGTPAHELRPIKLAYEPVRTRDGEWRPFLLDAVRRDCPRDGHQWLETPYMLALSKDGRRQIDLEIHRGELVSLPYLWPGSIDCTAITAKLNSLRIRPADAIWCGRLGERLSEKRRKDVAHVVCIAGKWKAARSQRDVLRLTDGLESLSAGEARLLLHCLPEEPGERVPETENVYVRCMARGILAVADDDVRMPQQAEGKRLLWFFERLHMLPAREMKASIRHATRLLDRWTRQPKSLFPMMDDHIRLFFMVRPHLKAALVGRVITHVFKKNRYWLGTAARDLTWVRDVYPSLTDDKQRARLYQGISHGAGVYASVADPDILLVNAACLQVYAANERVLLDYKLEKIEAAYQQLMKTDLDPRQQAVMEEVRSLIDTIPAIIAERQAEIERRRSQWDRHFARHAEQPPEAAAA